MVDDLVAGEARERIKAADSGTVVATALVVVVAVVVVVAAAAGIA